MIAFLGLDRHINGVPRSILPAVANTLADTRAFLLKLPSKQINCAL
jgi:hypothetical protein